MQPTAPGIFLRAEGLAAALNEDGSLNQEANPVAPGSVIVLFATGEGVTDPPSVDGMITGSVLPRPVASVEVTIGGEPAMVEYVGAAPGLVAGVLQVNARLSPNLSAGLARVVLTIGSLSNRFQTVQVHVGP